MSEGVLGLLLVPEGEDVLGLLAEGKCGARPPLAFWSKPDLHEQHWADCGAYPEDCDEPGCDHTERAVCSWCGESWPCSEAGVVAEPGRWRSVTYIPGLVGGYKGEALVLAWDGEAVPEGLDAWWRAGNKAVCVWPWVHPSDWAREDIFVPPDDLPGYRWVRVDAEGREVAGV